VSGPRAIVRDLRAFFGRRSREQGIAALLSLLVTGTIVILFILDPKTNTAPPATVTFVESWPATRTDAEIKVDQQKHQAEREAQAKARQQQYQELANSFGIE
jgi:hypothetical protein